MKRRETKNYAAKVTYGLKPHRFLPHRLGIIGSDAKTVTEQLG